MFDKKLNNTFKQRVFINKTITKYSLVYTAFHMCILVLQDTHQVCSCLTRQSLNMFLFNKALTKYLLALPWYNEDAYGDSNNATAPKAEDECCPQWNAVEMKRWNIGKSPPLNRETDYAEKCNIIIALKAITAYVEVDSTTNNLIPKANRLFSVAVVLLKHEPIGHSL